MSTQDTTSLHDKSMAELKVELVQVEKEYAQARIKKQAGKLENTHIALIADQIARIKSAIRAQELNG